MVKVDDIEIIEGVYYSENHFWIKKENGNVKVGLTDFAQNRLGQIVFLDLPDVGAAVKQSEIFGSVESLKTVSDMICPLSGAVKEVNGEVKGNAGIINEDPYGKGWILIIEPSNLEAELKELMDHQKAVEWYKEEIKKET